MIELTITKTYKLAGNKSEWLNYDREVKNFKDLVEAKVFLKNTYGNSKRVKMYTDLKSGESRHIGYVYSFKNYDFENGKKYHFFEQHWVGFNKVEYSRVSL